MLLKYLQSRLNKSFKAKIIMVLAILSLPSLCYPQVTEQQERIPGIIESLEKVIDIDKARYGKKVEYISNNILNIENLKKAKDFQLDADFVSSGLLRTTSKYLSFLNEDRCSFYNVMLANLIKTPEGKIDNVIVKFTNEKGNKEHTILSQKDFIQFIIKKTCPKVLENQKSFKFENFKKIVGELNISSVKDRGQCENMTTRFKQHPHSPYICRLFEVLNGDSTERAKSAAERYLKAIESEEAVSLGLMCENLGQQELLCDKFLSKNFWKTALTNEEQSNYAKMYCQDLLQKEKLKDQELNMCLSRLSQDEGLCQYSRGDFPALFPKPNCQKLSDAINHSRLFAKYQDCPGLSGNDAVSNLSRIIAHFKREIPKESEGICSIGASSIFAHFALESDYPKGWGSHICYTNKLIEKEVCAPSLLGNLEDSLYSEEQVVVDILGDLKGAKAQEKCQIVSEEAYNPLRLQFQSGCVLVYDKSCTASNCPKKVYYNEREIKGIEYKSDFGMDYFPNSVVREKYAQSSLIKRDLKLKTNQIYNLSILKTLFSNNKKALAHGIGCAEDIYPQHFQKQSLNQCTPLPFIIDGVLQDKNKDDALVIRTSLDDLYAPRIIDWSSIFTAVKTYQALHPMQKWSLRGFYK